MIRCSLQREIEASPSFSFFLYTSRTDGACVCLVASGFGKTKHQQSWLVIEKSFPYVGTSSGVLEQPI